MEEGRGEGEMEGSHTDGATGGPACAEVVVVISPSLFPSALNISHLISFLPKGIHVPLHRVGWSRLRRVRTKNPEADIGYV